MGRRLGSLVFRLRTLWRRARLEDEMEEELRAHLEHQVEANSLKEECRESWGVHSSQAAAGVTPPPPGTEGQQSKPPDQVGSGQELQDGSPTTDNFQPKKKANP